MIKSQHQQPKGSSICNLSLEIQNSIYSAANYIQFSNQIQTHDSSIRALALQLTNLTHFFYKENEALGVAAELPHAPGEQLQRIGAVGFVRRRRGEVAGGDFLACNPRRLLPHQLVFLLLLFFLFLSLLLVSLLPYHLQPPH